MKLHSIVKKLENKSSEDARGICLKLFKPFGIVEEHYSSGVNLVIRKKGKTKNEIIIAAHYDTFPGCPGANDNFSGIAVLYGIAQELWKKKLNHTLTLCIFDEEELNCIGSGEYIKQHGISNTKAMIDLELVGMGDVVGVWPVTKQTRLLSTFENVFHKRKQQYETIGNIPWFWADFTSFRARGLDESICVTLVEKHDVQLMRTFLSQNTYVLSIKLALGLIKTPKFFKLYHSAQDTADNLSEKSLNLAKNVVIDAIKALQK